METQITSSNIIQVEIKNMELQDPLYLVKELIMIQIARQYGEEIV